MGKFFKLTGVSFLFSLLHRSISQNSSVLHEEEDEKSCSESEIRISRRKSPLQHEEVIISKGFASTSGLAFC